TWAQSVITGANGTLSWSYRQSDASNGSANTYQKTLSLTDFVYEVKARLATTPSGSHAADPTWRYVDTTHFYGFDYGSGGMTGIWEYDGSWSWLTQNPAITYPSAEGPTPGTPSQSPPPVRPKR
ncbi:MAG: hypothetical protein Q7O66_13590, partial [Dehalococcoidia bacterium]|nr:hypothetical protein [Dehalococcoidia bacterium]